MICKVVPPKSWSIEGHDAGKVRIVTFLERNAGETILMPHEENRAARFTSKLSHCSDALLATKIIE